MKSSRTKSCRRSSKAVDAPEKKQDTGLSPSKRHREKLNNVMDELSELLPLSSDVKSSLDRLSVLKLTVSFFQTQNLMKSAGERKQLHCAKKKEDIKKKFRLNGINLSEMALEAIGGFFIVLTEDGNVYYVSENVKNHLGYTQARLMHQEFFSHVHPEDVQGLKSCFEKQPPEKMSFSKEEEGNMQFTLPDSRQECYCNVRCHAGRLSSHISPFYYKCFRFYGHLKIVKKSEKAGKQYGFFALCSPVSRSVNVTRPIKEHVEKYTCKMDAAMANLQVDSKGLKVLRFNEQDLIGKSAYFFFHPDDLGAMALVHERLIKDFKTTITFRIVKGNGKWQWVRGTAYTIMKDGKIEGMVANNIFVSDEEGVYYKAQNIKEIKEWKEQQEQARTSYQSSTSSSCSSPDNCSWSSDTEKSFQSLSCSPTGFINSTANGMALAQTPTACKSPSNINGYALPLPEAGQESYQAASSRTVCDVPSSRESIPNALHNKPNLPHFNTDVIAKSEVTVSSQIDAECLAIMDNELISTIIRELQTSAIDETGADSVPPCSSSATAWANHTSCVEGLAAHTGLQNSVGGAGIPVATSGSCISEPYPVTDTSGFRFEFEVNETPLLQDGHPFVGKHTNRNYFQTGVVTNNQDVKEDNVYPMNLKEGDSSSERLQEESFREFKDFEMLPLGDIESILSSHESNSYSMMAVNQPILEHVFMDTQSSSLTQGHFKQKSQAANLSSTTQLFETELASYRSQVNTTPDGATTADLRALTYTQANGNDPAKLPSSTHLFQTGLASYRSQANPTPDGATTPDLRALTYTQANGNDPASQIDKKYNGTYFEGVIENCKFLDHQSDKNHATPYNNSAPINHANALMNFNPETGKLAYDLSVQPATAWMNSR